MLPAPIIFHPHENARARPHQRHRLKPWPAHSNTPLPVSASSTGRRSPRAGTRPGAAGSTSAAWCWRRRSRRQSTTRARWRFGAAQRLYDPPLPPHRPPVRLLHPAVRGDGALRDPGEEHRGRGAPLPHPPPGAGALPRRSGDGAGATEGGRLAAHSCASPATVSGVIASNLFPSAAVAFPL